VFCVTPSLLIHDWNAGKWSVLLKVSFFEHELAASEFNKTHAPATTLMTCLSDLYLVNELKGRNKVELEHPTLLT